METPQNDEKIARKIILLKIYTFFSYFTSVFYLVFILIWFEQNGISVAQIFLYNLLTVLVGLILNNIFSHLSDRSENRIFFLILSDIISAIGLFIIVYVINLLSIILFAFLVYAISRETMLVALYYDLIDKKRQDKGSLQKGMKNQSKGAKEFTKFRILGSIGWAVGGPLAGYLITIYSFNFVFIFAAFLHFFLVGYLILITKGLGLSFINNRGILDNDKALEGDMDKSEKSRFKLNFSILQNKEFLVLLAVMCMFELGNSVGYSIKTIYAKELGGSFIFIGTLAFIWAICEVPLFFLSAKIVENYSYKIPIFLGASFILIKYYFYLFIITPETLILFMILEALNTFGIIWPAITYAINNIFTPENKALGTSIYSTFVAMARFFGNMIGAFLSIMFQVGEATGTYKDFRILFIFGLLVVLIALIIYLIFNIILRFKNHPKKE